MKAFSMIFVTIMFYVLLDQTATFAQTTDLTLVETRITSALLQQQIRPAEIDKLLQTQRPDGTWPGINYVDTTNTAFEHRFHLANLVTLSRAYRQETSGYHRHALVLKALQAGLNHWIVQDYICQNWWYNQIGVPDALVSVLLLMGDELDPALVQAVHPIIDRAHIDAPGARPGGDRIKIAGIQAKHLLVQKQSERFAEIIRVIAGEIKLSEWVGATYGYGFRNTPGGFANREMGGRGIMHDFSFHHRVDGVNNTLSYGLGYARAFIEWAMYVRDTRFAFPSDRIELLTDYFLDGICKTAVFGKYPDAGARNRSISRQGALQPYSSRMAEELLMLTSYRKEELQEIADIRNGRMKPTRSHATYYWDTEHFTVQRPGWFASVRMYSTRNHNMEQPYNSEGLLNHHRGDGANHLSLKGDEYLDIWPVYDYQKIPGATILQKIALPGPEEIQKLGLTDFVGAATDGHYGAAAFDFRSPHDPLIARKSWFFFDRAYVCLGAGISSRDRESAVATTLNQAHLRGEVLVSGADGHLRRPSDSQSYDDIAWVHHDGVGYAFPRPAGIHVQTDAVEGSWWRINKQTDSPRDTISLEVFKLWLDHGIRPSDETYAYIVYPAVTAEAMPDRINQEEIAILNNQPDLQAVYHAGLQQWQAVFYKAGTLTLNDRQWIQAHAPGMVLVRRLLAGKLRVTVSDPSRTLDQYRLTFNDISTSKGPGFSTWRYEDNATSEVIIDLPTGHYRGSSVTVEL